MARIRCQLIEMMRLRRHPEPRQPSGALFPAQAENFFEVAFGILSPSLPQRLVEGATMNQIRVPYRRNGQHLTVGFSTLLLDERSR